MDKICSKCKVLQPLCRYHKARLGKDGLAAECKDCRKRYRLDHTEETSEWKRAYYIENKEAISLSAKLYRNIHKEEIVEKRKAYYENNRAARIAHAKLWKSANPGKMKAYSSKRRASISNHVSSDVWVELISLYGEQCMFPNCERTDITLDHIIPISKGGAHSIDNFQILCMHHNCSKGNRNSIDYRPFPYEPVLV